MAVDFVRRHEGLKLDAYQDGAGRWTIGYGHAGPDVRDGLRWTEAEAEAALEADLRVAEAGVRAAVKRALGAGQWAALISLAFNVGVGALTGSTLLRLLNAGDELNAAHEFARWAHVGGRELRGLLIRRFEEAALFLKG